MYIYEAALWCDDCGEDLRKSLPLPEGIDRTNEHTWDSDDYPKGPYPVEESDVPGHCDGCGAFLENPLTNEGRRYVAEALVEGSGDQEVLETWASHYCPDYGWIAPDELSEDEQKALKAWADNVGDPEYALEKWWEAFRGIHDSMEDYAQQLAEDTGMWDFDTPMGRYFDSEAFARDMELSGDCFFAEIGYRKVAVFDNHV